MERILVVGCGGIGGVVAASLVEQGLAPSVVARPAIAEALRLRGFDLRDDRGRHLVQGAVEIHESIPPGPWDLVLLAVPPDRLGEAAIEVAPRLAPRGSVVCFQNGLAEERLAPLVGADRVIGAVVAWGASAPEPGIFERTSQGGFTLGRLDGSVDPVLERVASILGAVGPVELTTNLRGARWSKLAINCAISSLGTLGGSRVGPLLRQRFVRRLALEVMTEAVAVAEAEGVRLERLAGTLDLQWIALTEADRAAASGSPSLLAKHGLLLAVGTRYRRLRSSMLAAIERGRTPPVDFLNGEVVERARRHGLAAPVNEKLLELIHAVARRELKPGPAALERLFEETRGRAAA